MVQVSNKTIWCVSYQLKKKSRVVESIMIRDTWQDLIGIVEIKWAHNKKNITMIIQ